MVATFKGKIAGRFYAEFYFYLAVFVASLYLAVQPGGSPWVVLLAVVSTVFFLEMLFLMNKNLLKAGKAFVKVDARSITVSDDEGAKTIAWKDVDGVMIAWFSRDKWLEWVFGLDPSILIKTRRDSKGEAELGIAPDFFRTQEILVEMQKLYPKKVYFA
ncbi:MAG: hypothetical protein QXR53_00845 [Candidatus Norongarragalinales archaeon]